MRSDGSVTIDGEVFFDALDGEIKETVTPEKLDNLLDKVGMEGKAAPLLEAINTTLSVGVAGKQADDTLKQFDSLSNEAGKEAGFNATQKSEIAEMIREAIEQYDMKQLSTRIKMAIKEFGQLIKDYIIDPIKKGVEVAQEFLKEGIEKIGAAINNLKEKIQEFGQAVKETCSQVINKVTAKCEEIGVAAKEFKDKVVEKCGQIVEKVTETAKAVGNKLVSAVETVKGYTGAGLEAVQDMGVHVRRNLAKATADVKYGVASAVTAVAGQGQETASVTKANAQEKRDHLREKLENAKQPKETFTSFTKGQEDVKSPTHFQDKIKSERAGHQQGQGKDK